MLFSPLDTRSPTTLYEQIVEQVRAALVRGDLRPGDRLPSIRDVAVELRVNRNTVAQAYRALKDAAILDTNGARGAFITDGTARPDRRQMREQLDRLVAGWLASGVDPQAADEVLTAHVTARRSPSPNRRAKEPTP